MNAAPPAPATDAAAMRAPDEGVDIVDATGVSPRFVYHEMDVVVVEGDDDGREARRSTHHRMSNRSSFNNQYESASAKERRFACQFDPSLKNGRSLVRGTRYAEAT